MVQQMNELKPCPYCGGRHLSGVRNETGSMVTVCDTCEAMGPSQVGMSIVAIFDAWNTRTPQVTWQPIDTAPKDGYTRIILYQSRNQIIKTGFWDMRYQHWAVAPGPMGFMDEVSDWTPLPNTPKGD